MTGIEQPLAQSGNRARDKLHGRMIMREYRN